MGGNVANDEMAIIAVGISAVMYVATVSLLVVGMVRVTRSKTLTSGAQSLLFAMLGLLLIVIFLCPVLGLFIEVGL